MTQGSWFFLACNERVSCQSPVPPPSSVNSHNVTFREHLPCLISLMRKRNEFGKKKKTSLVGEAGKSLHQQTKFHRLSHERNRRQMNIPGMTGTSKGVTLKRWKAQGEWVWRQEGIWGEPSARNHQMPFTPDRLSRCGHNEASDAIHCTWTMFPSVSSLLSPLVKRWIQVKKDSQPQSSHALRQHNAQAFFLFLESNLAPILCALSSKQLLGWYAPGR